MSNLPVFGAGIWHFATYVDRYATDGYGPEVGLLEQIDKAGAVGDLSVVDLNWPFAGFDDTLDDVKAALTPNHLRAVAITRRSTIANMSRDRSPIPTPFQVNYRDIWKLAV